MDIAVTRAEVEQNKGLVLDLGSKIKALGEKVEGQLSCAQKTKRASADILNPPEQLMLNLLVSGDLLTLR